MFWFKIFKESLHNVAVQRFDLEALIKSDAPRLLAIAATARLPVYISVI